MFRFLIEKLKQASGPFRQPRLVLGDLAEELLDLTEHYVNRLRGRAPVAKPETSSPSIQAQEVPPPPAPSAAEKAPKKAAATKSKKKKSQKKSTKRAATGTVAKPTPNRVLDVDDRLAKTLEAPSNQKKQEFKVLAILWDTKKKGLDFLSAKEISTHGEKLGLVIRHENVRKVIRMRLEDYVDIHTEQGGNGSVYRYRMAEKGINYFEDNYFEK